MCSSLSFSPSLSGRDRGDGCSGGPSYSQGSLSIYAIWVGRQNFSSAYLSQSDNLAQDKCECLVKKPLQGCPAAERWLLNDLSKLLRPAHSAFLSPKSPLTHLSDNMPYLSRGWLLTSSCLPGGQRSETLVLAACLNSRGINIFASERGVSHLCRAWDNFGGQMIRPLVLQRKLNSNLNTNKTCDDASLLYQHTRPFTPMSGCSNRSCGNHSFVLNWRLLLTGSMRVLVALDSLWWYKVI